VEITPPTNVTPLLTADPPDGAEATAFWKSFGFDPISLDLFSDCNGLAPLGHDIGCRLPTGMIGFSALKTDAKDMAVALDGFPMASSLGLHVANRNFFYFRIDERWTAFDIASLPGTVRYLSAGDIVPLSRDPAGLRIRSVSEIGLVSIDDITHVLPPTPTAEVIGSPLAPYSLRGQAAEFERCATQSKPLLGDLCMSGQATVWYAPPNAGKTLITLKLVIDAVGSGRINPANIYYVNADDSSSGFAEKMRLMDDLGAHTLSPGHKGLKAANLIEVLESVAAQDKARGVLIILDTVKKFVSLMDKSKASAFAQVCRQVVMRGGTILGLAHTTKNPNANGTLRYAGTTDLMDDFDAAYTLTPLEAVSGDGEKVVQFDVNKQRGNNVEHIAYAYASDGSISYEERLASVRVVDPDQLDRFQRIVAEKSDADVINAVASSIANGVTAKMALAKAAATMAQVSERAAIRCIETYTGDDPATHRWTYRVMERGAKVFALHPPVDVDPDAGEQPGGS
jgi:hypothetical protein